MGVLCTVTAFAATSPPNIVLVVADDLGYSDLGVLGGEIETPNLDRLARAGTLMTQFYATPTCSPSRAMLLTGQDNHRAGFGSLAGLRTPRQRESPAYGTRIRADVPTLAERLRAAGYATVMSGKWHVGPLENAGPQQRGFVRSYALSDAQGSYYADQAGYGTAVPRIFYLEDGRRTQPPPDFYATDFFTTKLLEYLDAERPGGRPFFAYLALTAPHAPLHAPRELIEKYTPLYAAGWEVARRERLQRLARLGLLPASDVATEWPAAWTRWDVLSGPEQRVQTRLMAIYAAMVERLDYNVGRVLEYLRVNGLAENTIVVFVSDNGPEATDNRSMHGEMEWIAEHYENRYDQLGSAQSYVGTGPMWAHVSATPFSGHKGLTAEGGIRVPLIAAGPGIRAGARVSDTATLADLAATILDWAGVAPQHIAPALDGQSFQRRLTSPSVPGTASERTVFIEGYGHAAVRDGRWKARRLGPPWGDGQWRLFDVVRDPMEFTDLAASHRRVLQRLVERYERYAKDVGVVPPDTEPVYLWGHTNQYPASHVP